MTFRSALTPITICLCLLAATGASEPALAQSSAGASTQELPEIVVEGATIAVSSKPKAAKAGGNDSAQGQASSQKQGSGPSDAASAAVAGASEAAAGVASDPVSGAAQPISQQGTAVSVVTGEDLRARQISHAGDALRSLPGVSVSRSGGAGNETVVRIRGAESNQTLVLIDGVEMNPGISGLYAFENLSTDDIARIEVLRGPQSGLYGSNALAGVINVITTDGRGPLTVRARTEAGSFDTSHLVLQASGGTDAAHGAITYARRQTNGFDIAALDPAEDDGSTLTTFSAKGGVKVMENLKIDAAIRQSLNEGGRDGFSGVDAQGFFVTSDDASEFETLVRSGIVSATLDTFDGAWVHQLRAFGTKTDSKDNDLGPFPTFLHAVDERTGWGYTSTLRIETPGLAGVRHYVTGMYEDQDESFVQPSGDNVTRERERQSVAGEVRGEYFDTVFLGATVRHDDSSVFGTFTSWRGQGSVKLPGTGLRVHGSAGTGIKYPSFGELFGTFFRYTPNPALQAEESFGWDGGAEMTFLGGRAVIDVTYFEANLENEIADDFSGFPLITSVNLDGESTRKGVEVEGRVQVVPGVTLGAAYTYLESLDPDGNVEVRRPKHTGRFDVDYLFDRGRGRVNLAAVYNGKTDDVAFNLFDPTINRVTLEEFWLVTLAASYAVTPNLDVYGRVENALDEDYQEVFSYETAGASAYAGLRFKLDEPSTRGWAKE